MLDDTEGLGRGPAGEGGRDETIAGRLLEEAHGYVGKRKADAVRAVSDVAAVIRGSGAGLGEAPHLKAFFDSAAEGVEALADGIAARTPGEIYDEVDAAIRRRPGIALAAAALAGFALFRLVRAAGPRPIPRSRALVPAEPLPIPDPRATEPAR
ncbi:hypothetical protein M446_0739 [Methylobacterium sp. 4-46]|uniref:hypothetical protein n=1 Tax=unclassified Methylobacterium TaxID=2615210 RepID=UPI000152C3F7|nr:MULTISPECIES: hypothetical protein [Methylobacterium]ACA15297.1 hypothetical protein M446_0739 [Methylobacterium sp. 4-46]WFT81023.1 hypothetical protein QA634_03720 [Methylobacterium nodulans]